MYKIRTPRSLAATTLGLLSLCLTAAQADVTLPSLISTHAILQKSEQTRIWGKAASGEEVKVTLGDVHATTTAGADGKWRVGLDLSHIGEGPFDLIVQGANRLVVSDVLVGEVWVCSGQSNMAYSLGRAAEGPKEVPQSANLRLRQFRVDSATPETAQDDCKGTWVVASPQTTKGFGAVAYFFGKNLQQKLKQPVGLILSAWSGTSAMAWLSPEAIDSDPEWKKKRAATEKLINDYPRQKDEYLPAYHQWEDQFTRIDHPCDPVPFLATKITDSEWKKVTLPSTMETAGLPGSGAVWFRRKFTIPPGPLEGGYLHIGAARDFNALYLNGKKIGETTVADLKTGREIGYGLPNGAVATGENTVAIRLFTPSERAAISNAMYFSAGATRVLLNGEWQAKVEFDLPALGDEARKTLPKMPTNPGPHNIPGRVFNGMINPLLASTIQGVVWYQGEQDTGQPDLYWKMFEAVIRGWRAGWGRDVPFYFCQLPNISAKKDVPENSLWAQLRAAQSRGLTLPNTGQAVLIDLGEEDVHPIYKKEAGERLARLALARTYKQTVVDSGPCFKSMKVEAGKAHLSFDHAEGGLVAKPLPAQYQPTNMSPALKPLVRHSPEGDLEGFAVSGDRKTWTWATAKIEGDTVIVSSPAVPKPVAVRYAWANNPTCNLANGAGLPASPFETGND